MDHRRKVASRHLRTSVVMYCVAACLSGCRATNPKQPRFSLAVFAPDGSSIVFSKADGDDCFLYKADIKSGVSHRLTKTISGCEFDAAFSADGNRLAFMLALGIALELANSDGSGSRVLVAGTDDNLLPTFVPHSPQILFLRAGSFEHYSPIAPNLRHKFDVFTIDSATGQLSQLTHQRFYNISSLSISRGGAQVAFTVTASTGDQILISPIQKLEPPVDRRQPRVPNAPPKPVISGATWLPDGHGLLFAAASQRPDGGFDYNVYRLTIPARTTEQLTNFTGQLDGFSVSVNGKRLAMLREDAYSVLDLDTHTLTAVPPQAVEN